MATIAGHHIVMYQRPHGAAARAMRALWEGLGRHGERADITTTDRAESCDLAILWSANWPEVIRACVDSGTPYLLLELGYLGDRRQWVSTAYNGLHGEGDPCVPNSPSDDRWAPFRGMVKPWRADGECVLIMEQINGDASVRDLGWSHWLREAKAALANAGVAYDVRPHPGLSRPARSLEADLQRARCVVTLTSTSGVDAVLAGVPTIAMHRRSMAWPVAAHTITPNAFAQPEPDRESWGRRLAYCQWSHAELADGTAWEHLRRGPGGCWCR